MPCRLAFLKLFGISSALHHQCILDPDSVQHYASDIIPVKYFKLFLARYLLSQVNASPAPFDFSEPFLLNLGFKVQSKPRVRALEVNHCSFRTNTSNYRFDSKCDRHRFVQLEISLSFKQSQGKSGSSLFRLCKLWLLPLVSA